MTSDQFYMANALKLAELGRYSSQPNPRVGCVVVKNDEIVGRGFHQVTGGPHAEVIALAEAGDAARGADVYLTLEPCSHFGKTPPCVDMLLEARPARVIVAMDDPNPLVCGQGIKKLKSHGVEVRRGICQSEAMALNRGFIKRMEKGLPFVTLKLATSLDGRIAMKNGESTWITSPEARRDVHRLRLEHCAIVTGINTVLADNPRMTARLKKEDFQPGYSVTSRQPLRVVLDSQRRLPENAAILGAPGKALQMVSNANLAEDAGESVIHMPAHDDSIDLRTVVRHLSQQQMNNVLIESGGTLAAGFIRSGLVDEVVVYQSPDIMGASAQAMINLTEILKMDEKIRFEYQDVRKIGRDLKLVLSPVTHRT